MFLRSVHVSLCLISLRITLLWDSGGQTLLSVALTVRQWMFQSELQLGPHFSLVFSCATSLPSSTAPFGLGHGSVHMPSCSISVFGI